VALLGLAAPTALTALLSPLSYTILNLTNYIALTTMALVSALNTAIANTIGLTSN
jgi:hypothetical protein